MNCKKVKNVKSDFFDFNLKNFFFGENLQSEKKNEGGGVQGEDPYIAITVNEKKHISHFSWRFLFLP